RQDHLGGFLVGQIIADVKYVPPLFDAADWWDFALSGPGSRRGVNRLLGRAGDAPWQEPTWLRQLRLAPQPLGPQLRAARVPELCAQNFQNCLCEADKWWRAKNGEGQPKQRYQPSPSGRVAPLH